MNVRDKISIHRQGGRDAAQAKAADGSMDDGSSFFNKSKSKKDMKPCYISMKV